MLKRLLFRVAKAPMMGKVVGGAFQYCGWAIPVKKLYSSREVIAFDHPRPSYDNHLILSPKRPIRNLQQMAAEGRDEYLAKIWRAAMEIAAARPEYRDAFTLVANGGRRQEVQQVHFHMFTHHDMVKDCDARENVICRDGGICVLEHPAPDWEIHLVLKPARSEERPPAYFRSVLRSMDRLDAEYHIVERGYSLVWQYRRENDDQQCPVFHLISGKKR